MRGIDGRDYKLLRGWLIFEDGTWRAHKGPLPMLAPRARAAFRAKPT